MQKMKYVKLVEILINGGLRKALAWAKRSFGFVYAGFGLTWFAIQTPMPTTGLPAAPPIRKRKYICGVCGIHF
jgi:hypothetical protein